jgi:hypothetical protein
MPRRQGEEVIDTDALDRRQMKPCHQKHLLTLLVERLPV